MQKSIIITVLYAFLCLTISSIFLSAENLHNKNTENKEKVIFNYADIDLALLSESEKPSPLQDEDITKKKETIRIINLGPTINYKGLDYAPTISADGRTLYFVSDRPGSKYNNETESFSHDFWATKKAERLDTNFFTPFNIDTTTIYGNVGVNTQFNEGAASIAADRQSLYFTGCNRPDGLGDCDLYKTEIVGDKWGRPINLGPNVNSERWESMPSISAGKERIYFASNRPGPNGDKNFDIWYSDYDWDLEEFLPAKNLQQVNTPGREFAPFIGADGVTLFFSSDGYSPNFGGLDFYVTRYDEETETWSTPQNMGEPINTDKDELFITLPAGGDVIYFSSKRQDLEGYQGDLDLFMAFVPSFYKTKIVKVTVIDECSQDFIPAEITIKNPITDKLYKDSVTVFKKQFEIVISNSDYGNPKDGNEYVNLEIKAINDKYGEVVKIERIDKPGTTERAEEAGEAEDEILVTLTLGQMPILDTEIDEAEHVRTYKIEQPEIADYRGLIMKEVKTWDLYPLLNYVFFPLGSAELPSRYITFNSPEETQFFNDTTIAGGTLDKYYHILNIYGFRLNQFPDEKIEIVGCNDGTMPEEKSRELSQNRAQVVYDYFKNVWGISEDRMKLVARDKPSVVSNVKDSLGIKENRRVEILCKNWDIMKPVFDKDPTIFPQPDKMKFVMKNGIEDLLVDKRRIEIKRGGEMWKVLHDIGKTQISTAWDWYSEDAVLPKDEVPFSTKLIITTTNGHECESPEIEIPVKQVKVEDRKIGEGKDSTLERYSLILFPFDRSDAGPINERIMDDYVYARIYPSSYIEVIGHTDVVGLYEHNMRLSNRRSATVHKGIQRKTRGSYGSLNVRGVGEDEPLYDNSLPEGRFYNRTVQVIIKTPLNEFEK
jgi:outer membrane protein OmpA-like peptidoglycan-associated protein